MENGQSEINIVSISPKKKIKYRNEGKKMKLAVKETFYRKLTEYYKNKSNKKPPTREGLASFIKEIRVAKEKRSKKNRREYFMLKTYDIKEIEGKPKVIRKSDQLPIIAFEDLFDIIFEYHIKNNHAAKSKLEGAFKLGKVNIPRPATEIFLLCCETCCARRKAKATPIQKEIKLNYPQGVFYKGQIDTINFMSTPYETYNTILSYQDHHTKFLVLRAVENDTPEIIAKELMNIFMIFGPPKILESHNGKYFVNKILGHLDIFWSNSIAVCGEPKDTPIPSRSPDTIEHLVKNWMKQNSSANWLSGLNFVQWQENISYNPLIEGSPYQALFGSTPRREWLTMSESSSEYMNSSVDSIQEICNNEMLLSSRDELSDEDTKQEITISEDELLVESGSNKNCDNCEDKSCFNCDLSFGTKIGQNRRQSSAVTFSGDDTVMKKLKRELEECLME